MKKYFSVAVLCMLMFLFTGCGGATSDDNTGSDMPAVPLLSSAAVVDGSPDEYGKTTFEDGDVKIYMGYLDKNIYVCISAPAGGWLSIGFNKAGSGMDGSNMLIGSIDNQGKVLMENDLGQGFSHNSVNSGLPSEYVLTEKDGKLIMEAAYPAKFPSDLGFAVDSLIVGQTYSCIYAWRSDDEDIGQKHNGRGKFDFILQ